MIIYFFLYSLLLISGVLGKIIKRSDGIGLELSSPCTKKSILCLSKNISSISQLDFTTSSTYLIDSNISFLYFYPKQGRNPLFFLISLSVVSATITDPNSDAFFSKRMCPWCKKVIDISTSRRLANPQIPPLV